MITKGKQLLILTFFLVCCAILFLPNSMKTVCATESCKQSGKYLYEVDVHGNAIFMGYTGTEAEWSIPSEIAGKKVTSIGGMYKKKNLHYKNKIKTVKTLIIPGTVEHIDSFVFDDCTNLEKVVIQDGMSQIGRQVFFGCSKLTEVIIPESVESIGFGAFYECINLKEITIPESVKSIESSAFYECTNLKEITIPKSVVSIGESAFDNCENLEKVTILENVVSIEDFAFCNCKNLKEIIIPESVVSIGEAAFGDCSSLAHINISPNTTYIGGRAFEGTLWLENKKKENPVVVINDILIDGSLLSGDVILPNTFSYIGYQAFCFNNQITSVVIPEGVKEIRERAFTDCENLSSVVIPEGVEIIDNLAFCGCKKIESLEIPKSVNHIGNKAFDETKWLENQIKKNKLFIVNNILLSASNATGDVTIPENVIKIAGGAFRDCKAKKVMIAGTVKRIEHGAFWDSGVKKVTISEGVEFIGEYAFTDSSVQNVTIPSSVKEIGDYAFEDSDIKKVVFSANVPKMGHGIFWGCRLLESVKLPNGITCIPCAMFYGCAALKTIIIPESVELIDSSAFSSCNATVIVLNKSCKIDIYEETIAGIVCGYKNSTAQAYSENYGKGIQVSKIQGNRKAISVQWKKKYNVDGYQIQYATNSKFKGVKSKTISKSKKSVNLKKLKSNKKYYVRIRAYKKVKIKGKSLKLYTGWSKVNTVKTK